ADLLEEMGQTSRALLQRWLAVHERWPDRDLAFCQLTGWHWWSSVSSAYRGRIHAVVPTAAQEHMPGGQWLYKTRQEAEAVLAHALEAAGLLGDAQPEQEAEA